MNAEAWFLYDSASGRDGLVRETFQLDDPKPDEVIAEPLYGAWEGNMGHAVERRPIDVPRYRNEPRVIMGNAGVVRVAECGAEVRGLKRGDVALVFSGCELDDYGYPTKIWGYDAPGTMGCLATRIRMRERNLIRIPEGTRHTLPQWAAFAVRYITAWSNWYLAYRTYRLLVSEAQDPAPNVWGWGGGTTLATVDLARRFGCRAAMLSGDDRRLETVRSTGVHAIDRRQFGDLQFDEEKFARDMDQRRRYVRAEAAFLACVKEVTQGRGVQIFVDNIGGPLLRATLRTLSREGVIATCGWKEGMNISYLRSVACIGRQQHINTHYASFAEAQEAVAYAERTGWMPPVTGPIYSFDEIPELAREFSANRAELFPIYKVNGA
jgi:NADPH:quinone reductase-like Zn-dependent oxidoreductase